ncbi:MAG: GTPase Era [Ignavibacteriaceae bacterium]
MTKAGYVAIIGKPNVGKSTLLNVLLGQKISITTSKPQTTRKRILGILSAEKYQIIFLDTPGILAPAYLLQEKMMEEVEQSVQDADILILILDLIEDPDGLKTLQNDFTYKLFMRVKKPKILLLNKIDLTSQEHVKLLMNKINSTQKFEKIIPVSALEKFNIQQIVDSIVELLPQNPKFYPDDIVSDENERFFVSEIIREKIFELYQEEIPYSCEVVIQEFKEVEGRKDLIQAEIFVEKDSQKGILIGKQGAAIKKVGEDARQSIEEFLQRPVFLELRVKVKEKWRSDENVLKSLGYTKWKE